MPGNAPVGLENLVEWRHGRGKTIPKKCELFIKSRSTSKIEDIEPK